MANRVSQDAHPPSYQLATLLKPPAVLLWTAEEESSPSPFASCTSFPTPSSPSKPACTRHLGSGAVSGNEVQDLQGTVSFQGGLRWHMWCRHTCSPLCGFIIHPTRAWDLSRVPHVSSCMSSPQLALADTPLPHWCTAHMLMCQAVPQPSRFPNPPPSLVSPQIEDQIIVWNSASAAGDRTAVSAPHHAASPQKGGCCVSRGGQEHCECCSMSATSTGKRHTEFAWVSQVRVLVALHVWGHEYLSVKFQGAHCFCSWRACTRETRSSLQPARWGATQPGRSKPGS